MLLPAVERPRLRIWQTAFGVALGAGLITSIVLVQDEPAPAAPVVHVTPAAPSVVPVPITVAAPQVTINQPAPPAPVEPEPPPIRAASPTVNARCFGHDDSEPAAG